jgi:(p)ppGpp synthase/HD superfamily hydrolase
MMGEMVQRAKELAYRAHAGQVDKAGRPYIEHVARVAAACADDPEAEAVAWLHDVLEDCKGPVDEQVIGAVGMELYVQVLHLTRDNDMPQDSYYRYIRNSSIALRVKLADIADNADESRLALLPPDVAARLRRKYAKALAALADNG